MNITIFYDNFVVVIGGGSGFYRATALTITTSKWSSLLYLENAYSTVIFLSYSSIVMIFWS